MPVAYRRLSAMPNLRTNHPSLAGRDTHHVWCSDRGVYSNQLEG